VGSWTRPAVTSHAVLGSSAGVACAHCRFVVLYFGLPIREANRREGITQEGDIMALGLGLLLFAAGEILRFVLDYSVNGLNERVE